MSSVLQKMLNILLIIKAVINFLNAERTLNRRGAETQSLL